MVNPNQDTLQIAVPAASQQPGPEAAAAPPGGRDTVPLPESPRATGGMLLGLALMAVAAFLFWLGLSLPNGVAVRTMLACFGTFALIWFLFRLRVFHRPDGRLVAAGAIAFFAAAVPFIEWGLQSLDRSVKRNIGGTQDELVGQSVIPPVPTTATAPPPPVAPEQAPVPAPPPREPADDVERELIAPAPDPTMGKIIRITRDVKLPLNGRTFLIREGSTFPFLRFADGNVTFLANDQEVSIGADSVAFTGASQETPEVIQKLAEQELMRLYPALAEKGSMENTLFRERVNILKGEAPALFKDPRWPLIVGRQLAKEERWRSTDPNEPAPEPASAPVADKTPPTRPADPAAPDAISDGDILPPPIPKLPPPGAVPQIAPK